MKVGNPEASGGVSFYVSTGFVLVLFILTLFMALGLLSEINFSTTNVIKGILSGINPEDYKPVGISIAYKLLMFLCVSYLTFVFYAILDSLYVDYVYQKGVSDFFYEKYSTADKIFNGIKWNFYRLWQVFKPPLMVLGAGILLLALFYAIFNPIMALAGASVGLTTFTVVFILESMAVLSIFSVFLSAWKYLVSSFGIEIAVSEPELKMSIVMKRAEKLAFATPENFTLKAIGILYGAAFIYQVCWIISVPQLIRWENTYIFLPFIILNLCSLAVLKSIKVYTYIDTLLDYYNRMTIDKKEYYTKLKNSQISHKTVSTMG